MSRWLITMTCEVEGVDEAEAWEKFHDLLDSPAEFDYSADIVQLPPDEPAPWVRGPEPSCDWR